MSPDQVADWALMGHRPDGGDAPASPRGTFLALFGAEAGDPSLGPGYGDFGELHMENTPSLSYYLIYYIYTYEHIGFVYI